MQTTQTSNVIHHSFLPGTIPGKLSHIPALDQVTQLPTLINIDDAIDTWRRELGVASGTVLAVGVCELHLIKRMFHKSTYDEVLRQTAICIESLMPEHALIFRSEQSDFLCVMPRMNDRRSATIGLVLAKYLATRTYHASDMPLPITIRGHVSAFTKLDELEIWDAVSRAERGLGTTTKRKSNCVTDDNGVEYLVELNRFSDNQTIPPVLSLSAA